MNKQVILIAVLFFSLLPRIQTQAKSDENANRPTITVTELDINDEALNLVYEIRNDSEDDAWIFAGWHILSEVTSGMDAGLQMAEDGHTLTIRARFNRSTTGMSSQPLYGRFVRLRPGDRQTEAIFIRLPACPASQSGHVGQQEQGIKHATRLAIELGYFQDNLSGKKPNDTLVSLNVFGRRNERLNSRDDEILIVDDRLEVKREDEQVIRTVIEDIRIPYEETRNYSRKIKSPGLLSYEKIEIQYKPSMLEYFFPYKSQQSLLSPDEMGYLQSGRTIVLNDKQDIHTVAEYIPNTRADTTVLAGIPVRYRSHAEVTCYSKGKPFLSFSICNDDRIVIEGKYLISFERLPSLKKLTPQIQAIDLRMRCAVNLKNLWYRLHFYNFQEALRQNDFFIRSKTLYPIPSKWCDDIPRLYPTLGGGRMGGSRTNPWSAKPYICPSAGEGKNHYAMNPNCKPDSPADMVLLFETKAGWNQHGGPELFTFDNHDPKGGCVLLNDGTVKFIRTEDELQPLRWR
ncbi:MAG: hypothetical protein A2Z25_03030 [Planctomycetes bacterium RBG_16_55_9]|nr:MAG: hypothetical protein A2Z25_03030 [Planctomycetes bacterium RBG_16_55_9]